jgi:hypothetical protein
MSAHLDLQRDAIVGVVIGFERVVLGQVAAIRVAEAQHSGPYNAAVYVNRTFLLLLAVVWQDVIITMHMPKEAVLHVSHKVRSGESRSSRKSVRLPLSGDCCYRR